MCDGRDDSSCAGPLDSRARLSLRLRAAELVALAMETDDPLERHRLITAAKALVAGVDQPSGDG
jgi:hypothetical protein